MEPGGGASSPIGNAHPSGERVFFAVSGTPSACGGKAFSVEVLRMPIRIMDSAVYLGRTLAEIFSREAMR